MPSSSSRTPRRRTRGGLRGRPEPRRRRVRGRDRRATTGAWPPAEEVGRRTSSIRRYGPSGRSAVEHRRRGVDASARSAGLGRPGRWLDAALKVGRLAAGRPRLVADAPPRARPRRTCTTRSASSRSRRRLGLGRRSAAGRARGSGRLRRHRRDPRVEQLRPRPRPLLAWYRGASGAGSAALRRRRHRERPDRRPPRSGPGASRCGRPSCSTASRAGTPPAPRPDLIRDAAGLPPERRIVLFLGRLGRERGLDGGGRGRPPAGRRRARHARVRAVGGPAPRARRRPAVRRSPPHAAGRFTPTTSRRGPPPRTSRSSPSRRTRSTSASRPRTSSGRA